MHYIRKALNRLFGCHYVVLEDFDGKPSISRARKIGHLWVARRFLTNVYLTESGLVRGNLFTDSWKPYIGDEIYASTFRNLKGKHDLAS